MENAVVYARFSSHNQTENSIEAQVSAAKAFAKEHSLNIIKIYADRAKTGTNDNREAFQQMLLDSNKKRFQVVIVWKVDRFGRNREEITMNKYRLKKNGVRLEYVAENISKEPEGVILESVLEGFAEYYSKALSQNVKRGMSERRRKGFITGGPVALGYIYDNGKYKVDEDQAKKIKDVFKMFISGCTYETIEKETGINAGTLSRLIRNETYIGNYHCGDEVIKVPNIIDEHTFRLANDRWQRRTRKRRANTHKYLLTGKLFCKCGENYFGSSPTIYHTYYRTRCNCGVKYIRQKDVESYVNDQISEILSSDTIVDRIYEKTRQKVKNLKSDDKKLNSLIKKRDNLYKAIEDGLPFSDVKDRLNIIEEEISKESSFVVPEPPSKEHIKELVTHIKSLQSNEAILENIIDKIIVDPETGLYDITFSVKK